MFAERKRYAGLTLLSTVLMLAVTLPSYAAEVVEKRLADAKSEKRDRRCRNHQHHRAEYLLSGSLSSPVQIFCPFYLSAVIFPLFQILLSPFGKYAALKGRKSNIR